MAKQIPTRLWWEIDELDPELRNTLNSETHTIAGYKIDVTGKTRGAEKQWGRYRDDEIIDTTWAKSKLTAVSRLTPDYLGSLDSVLTLFPHSGVVQIGIRTMPIPQVYLDSPTVYEGVVRVYDATGTVWGKSARNSTSMAFALLQAWWLWRVDVTAQELTKRLLAELI